MGLLGGVVIFDAVAYFLLPTGLAPPSYRMPFDLDEGMDGYYRPDPTMEFDIAPSRTGHHRYIRGPGYVQVQSNDLGCRDLRSLESIQAAGDYTYFAGDSFTWGWGPPEAAFPRLYEQKTGRVSLNCGVIATGQVHQLEKFRRTVARIGRYPSRVVLGYHANDAGDDFWGFKAGRLLQLVAEPEVLGLARAGKSPEEKPPLPWAAVREASAEADPAEVGLRRVLLRYSLTGNIAHHVQNWLSRLLRRQPEAERKPMGNFIWDGRWGGYQRNPYTRANRAALRDWVENAREQGYDLQILLIPQAHAGNDYTRSKSFRDYLDTLGAAWLDFGAWQERSGLSRGDLYYSRRVHLHAQGNQHLAEFLAQRLP